MTDGTGLTGYGYNTVAVPPTLGAARLASIDGPLASDTITYSYDELGRALSRSINGAANAASMVYDSLGRVQTATNPLGTFTYAYVNTTSRIDHVDIPGGQKTQFTYFDNLGDQRLKQIKNLTPAAAITSQFDYAYNSVGDITSWTVRQGGAATSNVYTLGYDSADQLRSAMLKKVQGGTVLKQYEYDYDAAGNRSTNQDGSTITTSSFNDLNQLTGQSGGGKLHFRGTVNETSTMTVGSNPATVDAAGNFDGVADVLAGSNTVPVVATDTNGNVKTNNYQLTVTAGANQALSYDLDGNLTADGTKTYEWDAANRLSAINYTGTTKRTEFTYDGLSRRVKILEKTGTAVNSTKKFVWEAMAIAEERNSSNKITRKHYPQGVQFLAYNPTTTTSYYYLRDHLGSIREMTDGTGAIKARYDYDPWGKRTKLSGNLDADFGFTSHYFHASSNLNLAPYRAYDSALGRWISRDPIAEAGGLNLYAYASDDPLNGIDPFGLKTCWKLILITAYNDKTGDRDNPLGPGDLATGDNRYRPSDLDPRTGKVKPGRIKPGKPDRAYPRGTQFTIYGNNGSVNTGTVTDTGAGFAENRPSIGLPNGVPAPDWLDRWTPSGSEDPEWDWVSTEVDDCENCPPGFIGD
jgi:RHS repeat-associated protein